MDFGGTPLGRGGIGVGLEDAWADLDQIEDPRLRAAAREVDRSDLFEDKEVSDN